MHDRVDVYVRSVITGEWEYSHCTRMYPSVEAAQYAISSAYTSVAIQCRPGEVTAE